MHKNKTKQKQTKTPLKNKTNKSLTDKRRAENYKNKVEEYSAGKTSAY